MSEQVGVQPTNFQTDTPTGQGGDASIREKAEQSAQAGKEAAGQVAQTAVSRAQDVAQEAQAQARNVVGEARDQLRGQVSEQHQNAVRNLRTLAEELHSMAANGQRDGLAAGVVGQAADRAQDAASWLETRQPGDVLEEVRRFARRRPGAFLFGALAAGVVAGRLTRGAVAAHSQQQQQPSGSLSSEAPPAPVATASATTQVGSTAAIGGAATGEPARHAYGAGPSWGDPTLNEGAGASGQLP